MVALDGSSGLSDGKTIVIGQTLATVRIIDSLNGVAIDSMDTAGQVLRSFAVPC